MPIVDESQGIPWAGRRTGSGATLTYEEIVEAEPAEQPAADPALVFFAMAERA